MESREPKGEPPRTGDPPDGGGKQRAGFASKSKKESEDAHTSLQKQREAANTNKERKKESKLIETYIREFVSPG